MAAVIAFETQIAEITSPPEDRRDEEKLYHLMPLSELQQTAPFLSDLIKELLISEPW
jgi:endothelin-converting enzyme